MGGSVNMDYRQQLRLMGYADTDVARVASAFPNGTTAEAAVAWLTQNHAGAAGAGGDGAAPGGDAGLQAAMLASLREQKNPGAAAAAGGDSQLAMAIEESLKTSKMDSSAVEPNNPHRRKREDGTEAGLKNTGNVCYFNSLLQMLYRLRPELFRAVLSFRRIRKEQIENRLVDEAKRASVVSDEKAVNSSSSSGARRELNLTVDEYEKAIVFLEEWRKLYVMLHYTTRRYLDPSKAVEALFKFTGQMAESDVQHDVDEWFNQILRAIDTAFVICNHHPNLVDTYFKCNFELQIRAVDKSNKPFKTDIKKTERQLYLNIDPGDLYSALDEYLVSQAPGYKLPDGSSVTANQELWFTSFPSVLCFPLRRVVFDKTELRPVKKNDRFDFPKTLYMSRYHIDNQDTTRQLRVEHKALLERKRKLQDQLESYTEFSLGGDASAKDAKDAAASSAGGQEEKTKTVSVHLAQAMSAVLQFVSSDHAFVKDTSNQQHVTFLQSMLGRVREDIRKLQEAIQQIDFQIEKLYVDMGGSKYNLFSVLVHDGRMAGQGHYWAYIRNVSSGSWTQYNDARVTDVDEQRVLRESLGGQTSVSSAYFLVYVAEAQEENARTSAGITRQVSVDSTPETAQDELRSIRKEEEEKIRALMTELVPEPVLMAALDDNKAFAEEIEKYDKAQSTKTIKSAVKVAVDDYKKELKEARNDAQNYHKARKASGHEAEHFFPDVRVKSPAHFAAVVHSSKNMLCRRYLFGKALQRLFNRRNNRELIGGMCGALVETVVKDGLEIELATQINMDLALKLSNEAKSGKEEKSKPTEVKGDDKENQNQQAAKVPTVPGKVDLLATLQLPDADHKELEAMLEEYRTFVEVNKLLVAGLRKLAEHRIWEAVDDLRNAIALEDANKDVLTAKAKQTEALVFYTTIALVAVWEDGLKRINADTEQKTPDLFATTVKNCEVIASFAHAYIKRVRWLDPYINRMFVEWVTLQEDMEESEALTKVSVIFSAEEDVGVLPDLPLPVRSAEEEKLQREEDDAKGSGLTHFEQHQSLSSQVWTVYKAVCQQVIAEAVP